MFWVHLLKKTSNNNENVWERARKNCLILVENRKCNKAEYKKITSIFDFNGNAFFLQTFLNEVHVLIVITKAGRTNFGRL